MLMAAEPIGTVAIQDFSQDIYSIDNWAGMPLIGPATMEEVNSHIDEAEREINECGGMSWDDFKKTLRVRNVPSYAV